MLAPDTVSESILSQWPVGYRILNFTIILQLTNFYSILFIYHFISFLLSELIPLKDAQVANSGFLYRKPRSESNKCPLVFSAILYNTVRAYVLRLSSSSCYPCRRLIIGIPISNLGLHSYTVESVTIMQPSSTVCDVS